MQERSGAYHAEDVGCAVCEVDANEYGTHKPDSGLGFQEKVLKPFELFPLRSKAGDTMQTKWGERHEKLKPIAGLCPASLVQISQSRPDSGLVMSHFSRFNPLKLVPSRSGAIPRRRSGGRGT